MKKKKKKKRRNLNLHDLIKLRKEFQNNNSVIGFLNIKYLCSKTDGLKVIFHSAKNSDQAYLIRNFCSEFLVHFPFGAQIIRLYLALKFSPVSRKFN